MLRLCFAFGDDRFQHFDFVIHGAPEVVSLAVHLHKNLVHMTLPFRECPQLLDSLSSDL